MTRQDRVAAGHVRDETCHVDDGLSLAELEAQSGTALPDREALSTIPSDPSTALLDIFIDLDAALDLAAPINAALAANANLALPIDAAVSANVLSPGSVSLADANQTSIIEQVLQADATASSNQDSAIMQGEGGGTAVTDADGQTGEVESAPIAAAPAEPVEQIAPVPDDGTATTIAEPAVEPAPAPEPQAVSAPTQDVATVEPETVSAPAQEMPMVETEAVPAPPADAAAVAPGDVPGASDDAAAAGNSANGHGSGGVSEIARSTPGAMSE
jgi:hypothetical protein